MSRGDSSVTIWWRKASFMLGVWEAHQKRLLSPFLAPLLLSFLPLSLPPLFPIISPAIVHTLSNPSSAQYKGWHHSSPGGLAVDKMGKTRRLFHNTVIVEMVWVLQHPAVAVCGGSGDDDRFYSLGSS